MSGIDASRLAEELNALLEQGRIVTWLDRNSEYADDLTPSKNCSTTPP